MYHIHELSAYITGTTYSRLFKLANSHLVQIFNIIKLILKMAQTATLAGAPIAKVGHGLMLVRHFGALEL
jgi:hypothetical protein